MMDQAFGRTPHGESRLQSSDRQPAVQAITNRPANDAARKQVDDDGQANPSLPRPDVGDIDTPLLVRPGGGKSWSMMLGATGQLCSLSVVRLNRRFWRALRSFSRIRRAVRRRPTAKPQSRAMSCNSLVIRGLP